MFLPLEEASERAREYLKSNGRSEKRQTTLLETMMPGSSSYSRARQQRAGGASHPAPSSTAGPAAADDDEPSATAVTSTLKGSSAATTTPSSSARSAEFYDTTSEEGDSGEETNGAARSSRAANGDYEDWFLRRGVMARTPTAATSQQSTGGKRKRSAQDDDYLDQLSSGGEEEWVAVTEMSGRTTDMDTGTGTGTGKRTHDRHRDAFVTPSAMRVTDVENGMPTPSLTKGKSVMKVLFKDVETSDEEGERRHTGAETAKKRRRFDDDGELAAKSEVPSTSTSTSVRLWGTDATIDSTLTLTPSTSSGSSAGECPTPQNSTPAVPTSTTAPLRLPRGAAADPANLTREVLGILRDHGVAAAVREEVRKTLVKHANQAKGYERGRDAARKTAKEAVDRAAGLQARVEELERSRQEARAALMSMREKLMGIWEKS